MSAGEGSVSRWLTRAQAGDDAAIQSLWERYFRRLVELARRKLGSAPDRESAEDVALSAFDSFCRGAGQGRFPQLADRDALWRLLLVITARKAARHVRDGRRLKRGGPKLTVSDADFEHTLREIVSREPTPEFAAEAREEYQRLLGLLGDRELESIALWRMEGYTVDQIAERLGYQGRTIKRKLRLIRNLWEREIA